MRPGKRRALDKQTSMGKLLNKAEQLKASVRAKVKHPFKVIKCQFGFTKVTINIAVGRLLIHRSLTTCQSICPAPQ